MSKKFWVVFLFLILYASPCLGLVKEDSFDFFLQGEEVVVTRETLFTEPVSRTIDLGLPQDAKDISLWLNNKSVQYRSPLSFANISEVKLTYTTKDFLDKNDFFVNMKAHELLQKLRITLTLSEGYELKLPVSEGLGSGSVFPKPSAITSDGQRIQIVWERDNFTSEDEFSILVVFREKTQWWLLWVVIIVVALVLLSGLWIGLRHKKEDHSEIPEKKEINQERRESHLEEDEKHLKEDEKQIIRILKSKEGTCEQGTIRFIGNFSKAKLSRTISELEERNIVYKEIKGKKNIIHLKKDH